MIFKQYDNDYHYYIIMHIIMDAQNIPTPPTPWTLQRVEPISQMRSRLFSIGSRHPLATLFGSF